MGSTVAFGFVWIAASAGLLRRLLTFTSDLFRVAAFSHFFSFLYRLPLLRLHLPLAEYRGYDDHDCEAYREKYEEEVQDSKLRCLLVKLLTQLKGHVPTRQLQVLQSKSLDVFEQEWKYGVYGWHNVRFEGIQVRNLASLREADADREWVRKLLLW